MDSGQFGSRGTEFPVTQYFHIITFVLLQTVYL